MKKILGTGLTGLVGSRVVELLSHKYQFENISTTTGIDITNASQVNQAIHSSDAEFIIHFAAKTDVDSCEQDKDLGTEGAAWKINVEGTRNVVQAASNGRKKLIYISTEFIFDGKNPPPGGYTEQDIPSPLNWYAETKYEGEKLVQEMDIPWLIVRISYPYRAEFAKKDFVRGMMARLQAGESVMGVTDHIFTPTFIDDVALGLDALIENDSRGIYHLVGTGSLTPYEAALAIAAEFALDETLVRKTTRAEFFLDKAQRPYALSINNAKISGLGVRPKTFAEGLQALKTQIS